MVTVSASALRDIATGHRRAKERSYNIKGTPTLRSQLIQTTFAQRTSRERETVEFAHANTYHDEHVDYAIRTADYALGGRCFADSLLELPRVSQLFNHAWVGGVGVRLCIRVRIFAQEMCGGVLCRVLHFARDTSVHT